MSEPKRYAWKVNEENDFDLIEHSKGEWVRYEDYVRLKAEVERLTEAWVDKKMQEDRDALLQQVERLTKQVEMSGNNLKRCNCQECEDARKELYARIALKKGGAK